MSTCEGVRVLKGTAALNAGNNLVITLPNISTITNGQIIRFCITNAFDKTTNPLGTVSVSINGTDFALLTKFGNNVRIDQLCSRRPYTVGVGAQTPSMTVLNCLPISGFAFPTYTAATQEVSYAS